MRRLKKPKKIVAVGLCILFAAVMTTASVSKTEAADYEANPGGTGTIDQALGCTGNVVEWLESHENDDYYLGTAYCGLDEGNPDACLKPNGEAGGRKIDENSNCLGRAGNPFER